MKTAKEKNFQLPEGCTEFDIFKKLASYLNFGDAPQEIVEICADHGMFPVKIEYTKKDYRLDPAESLKVFLA